MCTEELIEGIIDAAYPIYKKNSRGCVEALKLDRKEPVDIDGTVFCCWREYVCYKVAEYLKEKCPEADVELTLNGNDSMISIGVDDVQQQSLNQKMYKFLKDRDMV
jgi:hypothetical protein